ncbi:hypothetical protein VNO77_26905 [Canavalia gladiata]|uniref:Uncharacterized protein n=1 Tax=Canavalia gladiata TaxID=3824 RepID=A0AAN9QA16_CANGL
MHHTSTHTTRDEKIQSGGIIFPHPWHRKQNTLTGERGFHVQTLYQLHALYGGRDFRHLERPTTIRRGNQHTCDCHAPSVQTLLECIKGHACICPVHDLNRRQLDHVFGLKSMTSRFYEFRLRLNDTIPGTAFGRFRVLISYQKKEPLLRLFRKTGADSRLITRFRLRSEELPMERISPVLPLSFFVSIPPLLLFLDLCSKKRFPLELIPSVSERSGGKANQPPSHTRIPFCTFSFPFLL